MPLPYPLEDISYIIVKVQVDRIIGGDYYSENRGSW
jgi:hypothetical protein